jgi:hypothetical protein
MITWCRSCFMCCAGGVAWVRSSMPRNEVRSKMHNLTVGGGVTCPSSDPERGGDGGDEPGEDQGRLRAPHRGQPPR